MKKKRTNRIYSTEFYPAAAIKHTQVKSNHNQPLRLIITGGQNYPKRRHGMVRPNQAHLQLRQEQAFRLHEKLTRIEPMKYGKVQNPQIKRKKW